MRARLRKKLTRRATAAKLRAVSDLALSQRREQHPEETRGEAIAVVCWVLFHADFECQRQLGGPLFAGICWVKTERGPRPAWARKERRR